MRSGLGDLPEWIFGAKVHGPVPFAAEGDEVLGGIIAQQTPRTDVMHVKIVRAAAVLAAPPVSGTSSSFLLQSFALPDEAFPPSHRESRE